MTELTQASAAVEQQMQALTDHGDVTAAVKAEIDGIH
jgi:hypothetical protein